MVLLAEGNRYGLATGRTESEDKQKNWYGIALLIGHIDIYPRA